MQKRTKLQQQLLVASCAGLLVASSGCRSAMPKWNMFGGKAPSAETLAGAGPTITYPAPPSDSATPNAIASVAGGTAESIDPSAIVSSSPQTIAPVSGFDASRADLASAATNNAAARANGFDLASKRTASSDSGGLPGYAAPSQDQSKNNSLVPSIPAGYRLGNNQSVAGTPASSGSGYVMPSAYPAPGVTPMNTDSASAYALPDSAAPIHSTAASQNTAAGFGMPAGGIPAPAPSGPSGGFAMPGSAPSMNAAASSTASSTASSDTGSATNPQPFTPKTPTSMASTTMAPPTGMKPPTDMKPPSNSAHATPASTVSTGASSPSFSTASAALAPRSNDSSKSSGYAPGSTSGSGSYPTTSGYPSTGTDGSFYR